MPTDSNGLIVPWMSVPFVKFLTPRIKGMHLSIFEYGAGASTQYFHRLKMTVTSVESNFDWYNKVKTLGLEHVNLVFEPDPNAYCQSIGRNNKKYDLVVIDGLLRELCLPISINHVTPSGVIVLDNSDRDSYRGAISHVMSLGYRKIDFYGFAPCSIEETVTSVFYPPENILGI